MAEGDTSTRIDDGLGGSFTVDVFPKRATVAHRDAIGRSRSMAVFYGVTAREFAVEWVDSVLARRRGGVELAGTASG